MSNNNTLGSFKQLVLAAILELGENAYGVTIHSKVEELAQTKRPPLGAVYTTLGRMEDKGFVRSKLSEPTSQRGGRSKRHYRLNSAGKRILRESALTSRRVCDVVEQNFSDVIQTRMGQETKLVSRL